jgi:membrane protease YdiL (CAAX protease family)
MKRLLLRILYVNLFAVVVAFIEYYVVPLLKYDTVINKVFYTFSMLLFGAYITRRDAKRSGYSVSHISYGGRSRTLTSVILTGFCIGVLLFISVSSIVYIVVPPVPHTQSHSFLQHHWGTHALAIKTIVFAPIAEELIFRQYLLTGIEKKKRVLAVILVSLFFVFFHINQVSNIEALLIKIIPVFVTSIAFCYLYLLTKKILLSIIVHGIWNLWVYVAGYWFAGLGDSVWIILLTGSIPLLFITFKNLGSITGDNAD